MGARSPDRSRVARVWPNRHERRSLGAALAILLSSGCGHPAPPAPEPAPAPVAAPSPAGACLLGTSGVAARDTLTVVVSQSDSAPIAAANNFDTLIRLDCEGRAIPGLASRWTRDSSGTVWTFVLPDSTAPGALDIASAWNSSDSASAVLEVSGVKEAVPAEHGRLVVTLERPSESVPSIFADRSLGLHHPGTTPSILVSTTDGRDPRDLLDKSPDVLVTRDPAILDYASKLPGTVLTPLPWDRVYVLLLAPEGRPRNSSSPPIPPPSAPSSRAMRSGPRRGPPHRPTGGRISAPAPIPRHACPSRPAAPAR